MTLYCKREVVDAIQYTGKNVEQLNEFSFGKVTSPTAYNSSLVPALYHKNGVEQVVLPPGEELNKDVEYQASQRQTAEERIKKLSNVNRKKSFTGNFEADVGEAIRRNLRITHDDDTNSIHIFWNDHELD